MDIKYTPEGTKVVPVPETFIAHDDETKLGIYIHDGFVNFLAWSTYRYQYDRDEFSERLYVKLEDIEKLIDAYKETKEKHEDSQLTRKLKKSMRTHKR